MSDIEELINLTKQILYLNKKEQIAEKIINNDNDYNYHIQLKSSLSDKILRSSDVDKQILFEKSVNKFEKLLGRYLYFMEAYNRKIVIDKLQQLYVSYKRLIVAHYNQFYNCNDYVLNKFDISGSSQDIILFELIYYYYEAVSNLHKILRFFNLP